ncbi:MAG: hypothetical protein ACR2P0_11490 [Acidimicrobiales bacterium]
MTNTPTPPPFPQQPPGHGVYPESSNALTALILSILNFFICGLLAPFAWYLANKELEAIDNGRRDPTKRDQANAARILGIIGTVLLVVALVAVAVVAVVIIVASASG